MVVKLCRICDHELLAGAFCPVCRRVCRDPLILPDGVFLNKAHSAPDVTCEFHSGDRIETLLNRRHPKDEQNCSYHNPEGNDRKRTARDAMRHAKTGKSRDAVQNLRSELEALFGDGRGRHR